MINRKYLRLYAAINVSETNRKRKKKENFIQKKGFLRHFQRVTT